MDKENEMTPQGPGKKDKEPAKTPENPKGEDEKGVPPEVKGEKQEKSTNEEPKAEQPPKEESPPQDKPEQAASKAPPSSQKEEKKAPPQAEPEKKPPPKKSEVSQTLPSKNDKSSKKPERKFDIPKELEEEVGNIDLLTLTKEQLVGFVMKRHELVIKDLLTKIKLNNKFIEDNQRLMDNEKKKRDSLNKDVAKLKKNRQNAQSDTKKFREQFFSLIERDRDVEKINKELDVHKRYMEDVDWKLQTSAITLEKERQLIDQIKDSMGKINELSKDIQEKQGIQAKVVEISKKIDVGFEEAEDHHKNLLELAEKSEVHHEQFTKIRREIGEKRRQNSWMEHRIKMHSENLTYWQGQMKAQEKVDSKTKQVAPEAQPSSEDKSSEKKAKKEPKKKEEPKSDTKVKEEPKKDTKAKEESKKKEEPKKDTKAKEEPKKKEEPKAKEEPKKKEEPKEKEEPEPKKEESKKEEPGGGDKK
jgi:uncharacterized coiled-coil DUF342 family protein